MGKSHFTTLSKVVAFFCASLCVTGCGGYGAAQKSKELKSRLVALQTDWLVLRSSLSEEELADWDKRLQNTSERTNPESRSKLGNLIDEEIYSRLEGIESKRAAIEKELMAIGMNESELEALKNSVTIDESKL